MKIKLLLSLFVSTLCAQQISINRIDLMPNTPTPYEMRDWKKVAMGYDSLVFDLSRTGLHLPLIHLNYNTVNYPEHNSFVLHTVVGTPDKDAAEAINMIPAVVGASLVGIDKRVQNGNNWVLMCEEFFNKRPGENVYLNNFVGSSGSDWWYDTMPNIFFYQLYDLYPGTGDFDYQFTMVADRWLEAVKAMGGNTAPWRKPYMLYRAWALSTMTPLESGVNEPEAAGAIGWLLYHAFYVTGEEKYRIGAEWCLEFLDHLLANPAYELQLSYGACIAARMNAELGTDYDIEKILNWCFDVNNKRNWGATLGTWGEYDCSGLIGEAKYDGYAFAMNSFEQVGALLPLVRYDDRFARAIGKWILNCANACRLFYPNYLPDDLQDSEEWSHEYDPHSTIAHEALRQYDVETGKSPYATGDFIMNNWGPTNLTLYGSSHVGILGGIIDTTNVDKILQLDVLKTDYFKNQAFPTFLYYNPYDAMKEVEIAVGSGSYDLYDAVSNQVIRSNVSQATSFTMAADAAMLLVLIPTGGDITYDLDKMLHDNIVVDYRSGQLVENYPPRIKSLAAESSLVPCGGKIKLFCTADDKDNDQLYYDWKFNAGTMTGSGSEVHWQAPDSTGMCIIDCIVNDGTSASDTASVTVTIVEFVNHPPFIQGIYTDVKRADLNEKIVFTCAAKDPEDHPLTFTWSCQFGAIDASDSSAVWAAPEIPGYYYVRCTVDDGYGGQATDSTGIVVLNYSDIGTGFPIAYYPFSGNANDASGFNLDGLLYGATLVDDRFGDKNRACYFDGVDDFISVRNHHLLNFTQEISVSFWMNVAEFLTVEMHPISHGNWENRWKVSITPGSRTVRWTIKTADGIKDIDSNIQMITHQYYNITCLYDGAFVKIYINGELDSQSNHAGQLLTTDIDLTIGRVLPFNTSYNFKGILDDIRIYSYALSEEEIDNIYGGYTHIQNTQSHSYPDCTALLQNYPNPFNAGTTIKYQIKEAGFLQISIFDVLGRKVRILENDEKQSGCYSVIWDGKNDTGDNLATGVYFFEMKMNSFYDRRKLLLLK